MREMGECAWRVGRVAWVLQYLALLLPFAMSMVSVVDSGVRLPPIYWNASNTMFHSSNNDHVIDVHIGDRIDIICPHYTDDSVPWEYYTIYMVNKSNYEMCVINDTSMWNMIINCSRPNSTVPHFYTMIILDFQSIPGGNPDFKEGRSYYLITTSGGQRSNIRNQYQGACKTHKMKMIMRVVPRDDSPLPATTPRPAVTQSPVQTQPRTTTRATTTTTKTTTTRRTTTSTVVKTTGKGDETEEKVPGGDGFPGDNVIHVGVGDKNEGTITDSGAPSLLSPLTALTASLTVTISVLLCWR